MCKWRGVRICCHESPHGEAVSSRLRLFHTVSEGEFSEVRASRVLGTPPLAKNLDAFSRPSLPGFHLLTVASDNVSLVSVDGISAGAATHHVFDGRDVP